LILIIKRKLQNKTAGTYPFGTSKIHILMKGLFPFIPGLIFHGDVGVFHGIIT